MDTRLPRASRLSSNGTFDSPSAAPSAYLSTPFPSTSHARPRTSHAALHDMSISSLSHEQVQGLRRQSHFSTLSLSPRRPLASGSQTTERGRAGVQVDESGVDESLGEMEEEEGGMVERMRNWRNDAMTQHLYGTAEFWGGKVFGMTGELQLQLESGDWS
jgi:hypothetical protein